jgi:hypothetical protein
LVSSPCFVCSSMSVFIFRANTTLRTHAFICHLLHISAIFGHHQAACTTDMENQSEVETSTLQLILQNTQWFFRWGVPVVLSIINKMYISFQSNTTFIIYNTNKRKLKGHIRDVFQLLYKAIAIQFHLVILYEKWKYTLINTLNNTLHTPKKRSPMKKQPSINTVKRETNNIATHNFYITAQQKTMIIIKQYFNKFLLTYIIL